MRRFGEIIRVRPEAEEEYKKIHVKIWPEIEEAIREAGIRNYSIYLKDGMLFAYYEYHGPEEEFDERMAKLAEVSNESGWWTLTKGMQMPLETRQEGEWWASAEEVFHQD
ncbi:MAG: L-rhamnose mutarotase [Anaerolineae bacterium]|nr:L-rhamnose mutarotase [Anaerolineae bacterium]